MDRVRQTHDHLRELAASEPPTELKARVLAQVKSETPTRFSGGWWFWGSAAAALLVVAVLGIGLLQVLTSGSSTRVPLTATALAPEAGGRVQVEEVGRNFRVDLEVWGMPELKEGEYYAEDGGRISCGTFRAGPDDQTTVNLTAPVTVGAYPEIEITREPDDGNLEASGEEILEGSIRST
jgi:Anti-sigma-K factor rskA